MSRYLTPSKIAVLALVHLYCDSVVPSAAVVPFLSFILSTLGGSPREDPAGNRLEEVNPSPASAAGFEHDAVTQASSIPGRTIFDLFIKKLWEIDSLDALHTFIQESGSLFSGSLEQVEREDGSTIPRSSRQISLSRNSPLGIFVRRVRLEFTRLQFSDALKLWLAFTAFKEPTLVAWERQNRTLASHSFDRVLQELDLEPNNGLLEIAYENSKSVDSMEGMISASDIERILEFQVDRLQRLGTRVPKEMNDRLRSMVEITRTTPTLVHFVKFFDAWRAGDYVSSFDNLHRYFDYTLQIRDKSYYQYALLHMAILHADFGCFSEAVAAMNEAISTARENQDISCLNFSLNWLNHLSKAYPSEMKSAGYSGILGSERDALLFLKSKARDMKMWTLTSSALLSEARLGLSQGEPVSRIFEHVYQSSHLNAQHSIYSNTGAQLLMQSSVFARLGIHSSSMSYCDTLLDCYSSLIPQEEILRARCRKAFHLAITGRYDAGLTLLEDSNSHFSRTLRLQQQSAICTGLIKLLRHLRRSDTSAAESALTQLKASHSGDPDVTFELNLLQLQYYLQAGDVTTVLSRIEAMVKDLELQSADVYQSTQLAILKARLFAQAGFSERGFSVAMRAASLAQKASLVPALWNAVGVICAILVNLEEYGAVVRLLDAVIPQALEGGDFALIARLYSTQTDAYMGMLGQEGTTQGQKATSLLWKANLYLDRAESYYKKIEDLDGVSECLAKKAVIAHLRGDADVATNHAKKFLSLGA